MDPLTGTFVVNVEDNAEFARLSGDFNPLHMDETYARRLQFGSAVVHGVHHLLRALDHAFATPGMPSADRIHGLSVSFPNPVRTGHPVSYTLRHGEDHEQAELTATCDGLRVLAASVRLGNPLNRGSADVASDDGDQVPDAPLNQAFPPQHAAERVNARCDRDRAARLFPCLSEAWGLERLAQVLACTYIVGMRCPGLHSVFSGLDLNLAGAPGDAPAAGILDFAVVHSDPRFQMVRIEVTGSRIGGTLDAFFRPAPATQASYEEALAAAVANEFSGQRALVVGGSRGVGETTAKILAAGGASVCISYNAGHEDALGVQREIMDGGGSCEIMRLDVCGDLNAAGTRLNGHDHIYYFASPRIAANRARGFSAELFATYSRFYLSAFSDLVDVVMSAGQRDVATVTFYYPSSVYVTSPEKGFAEYAVAKAAGEALCHQLAKRHKKARFLAPRLPRMATDQTTSIVPVKCESTFEVMSRELRQMRCAGS